MSSMNDFEAALASVAVQDDIFGTPDFDPAVYLNKKFPHEREVQQSLGDVMEALQKEELEVENALLESMRETNARCANASISRLDIQADLDKLTRELADIEERATDTHSQVELLSRDIKSLDLAKNNLTMTVTRLKRFVMLVQALEQLRTHARAREYKQVANLLLACEHLADDFVDLSDKVEKVAELFESKKELLLRLRHQIFEDYDTILGEEKIPRALRNASETVDAMKIRDEILTRFCLKFLEEYKRVFQPPSDASTLQNADKRFAWLSHKLGEFAKEYRHYFAPEWECEAVLCEHFCHLSKQHFVEILSAPNDPELLIKVLRKTISFEHDLAQRYANDKFVGIIADCFDQFLYPWVDMEEAELCTLFRGEDSVLHTTDSPDAQETMTEPRIVYASAAEIFVHLQGTLKRSVSFAKRQTLRAVFHAFERVLRNYCKALQARIPLPSTALTPESAETIGAVLGTCDYVCSHLPKLEELFEEIEWNDDTFCFDECADVFGELMSHSAHSFLLFAEISFKPLFRQWLGVEDDRAQAADITRMAHQLFETVQRQLNTTHFRFFADKFAQWFVPELIDSIYTSQCISEYQAQQLLVDTLALKEAFVQLPQEFNTTPHIYQEVISTKMEQALLVFRVLVGDEQQVSPEQRQRIESLRGSSRVSEHEISPEKNEKSGKAKFFASLDQLTRNTNQFAKKNKWLTSLGKYGEDRTKM